MGDQSKIILILMNIYKSFVAIKAIKSISVEINGGELVTLL